MGLFRARPEAPWACYLLPVLVSLWFALWGFGEEGFSGAWPYVVLLVICTIQIRYRTVIGWLLVLLPYVAYTVAVAASPRNGPLNEYIVFLLTGLIPTAALAFCHPFRGHRMNSHGENKPPSRAS